MIPFMLLRAKNNYGVLYYSFKEKKHKIAIDDYMTICYDSINKKYMKEENK